MRFAMAVACAIACGPALVGQTATSSVEGKVLNAVSGAPVRRAKVTLQLSRGVPSTATRVAPGFRQASSAETDDQGRFTLRGLLPGGYSVLVERQGFLGPGQGRFGSPGGMLMVGENQQITGVTMRLTPHGVISGKVLDESGDPVAGVNVIALRWGFVNGKRQLIAGSVGGFLQTNDLGEYRIASLPAGKYFMMAGAPRPGASAFYSEPAAAEPAYTSLYYPSAMDPGEAKEVEAAAGAETRGIDIRLRKVKTVTIRGRVVDPGAPPERPASVSLMRRGGSTYLNQVGYAISMPGGEFRVVGVPPGSYTLMAGRSDRGALEAGAFLPIEVGDRNIDGIVVQVSPAVEVEGVVRSEPPGRCTLGFLSLVEESGFSGGPVSNLGREGKFTTRGLIPGTYTVTLPGMGACYVRSVRFAGREAAGQKVRVDGKGPLEITMAWSDAVAEGTVTDAAGKPIEAVVSVIPKDGAEPSARVTAAGRTGAWAAMGLRPGTYDVYAWESMDYQTAQSAEFVKAFAGRAKTVTVGESGRHTVPPLTAIPASETGGAAATPPFTPAKASVEGTVVNGATGAPMAGVRVTLSTRRPTRGLAGAMTGPAGMAATEATADTDQLGRFTLREVEPDVYFLSAAKQGFSAAGPPDQPMLAGEAVIVGNGQRITDRVVRLTPQSVIAGRVTDEFGEAVANAVVAAHREERTGGLRWLPRVTFAQTDDLGKFRVAGLPPGSYYLAASRRPVGRFARQAAAQQGDGPEMGTGMVWYPDAADASGATAVVVGAAAEIPMELVLRRTRVWRVRGTVVDESGAPVERAMIGLSPRGMITGMMVGSVAVGPGGGFEISGVPAGSYLLSARGGEGSPQRQAFAPVEVRDGNVEGARLVLRGPSEVRGTVRVEGGGQPFASVMLQSAESLSVSTAASGTFRLAPVWPVSYAVVISGICEGCSVKSVSYGGNPVPAAGMRFEGGGELEIVVGR